MSRYNRVAERGRIRRSRDIHLKDYDYVGGKHVFSIEGTTDDYYITFSQEADEPCRCTCPDFAVRNTFCKHCIFLIDRGLRIRVRAGSRLARICEKEDFWTKLEAFKDRRLRGTQPDEWKQELAAGSASSILAENFEGHQSVDLTLYVDLTEEDDGDEETEVGGKRKRLEFRPKWVPVREVEPDEQCAICLDDLLDPDDPQELIACRRQCGKSVHAQCFALWSASRPIQTVTCVHCRAKWPTRREWALIKEEDEIVRNLFGEKKAKTGT